MVPAAGRVLRAGKVPSKHIAPPAPEEGENSQRCCSPTPFGSVLAWCPSREVPLSPPFPNIHPHPATSLPGSARRVSQRRGWQLEAYVPSRGCGGRSPQAAVAGGEMAAEGSTEAFWCQEVPHVPHAVADGQRLAGGDATLEHAWHQGCSPAVEQPSVPGEGQRLFPPRAAPRLGPGREGGDRQP